MIIYQDEPFYLQNKFAEYKREKTAQSNSSRDRSVRRVRSKKKVLNGHDIRGAVYEEELQIVKNPDLYLVEKILRKKRDLIYVKWLGFDNSHNSWINKKDML